eukprot:gene26603-33207_t
MLKKVRDEWGYGTATELKEWGRGVDMSVFSPDGRKYSKDVETFGNVTLEALSAGCPAVVEKKCGEHLVEHGVNGLTCPCDDFEAFYQATRRLVLDRQLRNQMSKAAREKAWKFERNIILQQMAQNYKDAIDKHRDPMFLKKHLENHEGAGRNLLSFFCCNYYFVKLFAEPFLNTSRGVQDLVDGSADCVQNARGRLSCGDFLASSANLASLNEKESSSADLNNGEENETNASKYDEHHKDKRSFSLLSSIKRVTVGCLCNPGSYMSMAKLFNGLAIVISLGIVLLFIYASFTV